MPDHTKIVQFVGFETALTREFFLPRWEPFAASFLSMGIERVDLGESGAASKFLFISRNVWPAARFRSVFPSRLPSDAGGGGVTAVQLGAFRVAASEGIELLAARRGVVKSCALTRCRHDEVNTILPLLDELGRQHGTGLGWATYTADPATRGGRFDAVLEVYAAENAADRTGVAVAEALQRQEARIEESRVLLLREVFALP